MWLSISGSWPGVVAGCCFACFVVGLVWLCGQIGSIDVLVGLFFLFIAEQRHP